MRTIGIAEFKAKCVGIIRQARRTGRPVLITRRGEPLVRLEPVAARRAKRELGVLCGSVEIKGDIVHGDATGDWEMLG